MTEESLDFLTVGDLLEIAAGVLGVVAWRSGAVRPSARAVRNAAIIGVMLLIGGVGMVTLAEDRGLDSGVAATLIAVQPMLASVWSGFFGRWPRRIEWLGMTIGLAGVAVLSLSGSLAGTPLWRRSTMASAVR